MRCGVVWRGVARHWATCPSPASVPVFPSSFVLPLYTRCVDGGSGDGGGGDGGSGDGDAANPPPISEKLWYLAGGARKLPRHDEEGNIVGARARKPRGTHRINFHPFGESDFYNAVTLVYSDFRRC
ncbi:hypothetical protein V1477_020599 [Vespula maculifrons]|uniref:Uncharacterized protein n=1 Tax=Vespula maculifrons TaxID=7453 RepID=A0ABD2AME6_VESMC